MFCVSSWFGIFDLSYVYCWLQLLLLLGFGGWFSLVCGLLGGYWLLRGLLCCGFLGCVEGCLVGFG